MICVCLLGPEKGVLENRQKVLVFRLNDMGFNQKNAKILWLSLLADACSKERFI